MPVGALANVLGLGRAPLAGARLLDEGRLVLDEVTPAAPLMGSSPLVYLQWTVQGGYDAILYVNTNGTTVKAHILLALHGFIALREQGYNLPP
jgi:hypothetical protein